MAQKTYSIANFSQTSSWEVRLTSSAPHVPYYYQSPTTDTDVFNIVPSDIPAGSTITGVYIEATLGSPNTGIDSAKISFALNGGAYSTASDWDDRTNPWTEPIPVAYISPSGWTSIRFSFKANGSVGSVGSFSGTLSYSNITVYVDYTEPVSKCTPPTAVSVTPSSTGKSKTALLSWSGAGSGTNNLITGYEVWEYNASLGYFTYLTSVTASPMEVTSSGTNGGQRFFKVKAKGEAGADYYSDLSDAMATLTSTWSDATAPSSVTGPTNVVPGSTQTISWSGASAGVNNPILEYRVYSSADGYTSPIAVTPYTSVNVTAHPTSGQYYTYLVLAVAELNVAWSTASHTMTSYVGPVTAPSSVSFDANNLPPSGQTTIRWSGQSGGINNAITRYDVEQSSDNANWSLLASTYNTAYSPVTSSATNNATVYYRVKVVGERSNAYSSSIGLVTTVTKPTAPTSISLNDSDLPVGWSVAKTLSWSGAAAGTNNAIYGYRIMVSVNGAAAVQYGPDLVTANTSGSVSVTSLASNGTQKFYVYTIGATSVTAEKLSALSTANDTLTTTVTNPTAPTASIPTNVAPGSTQSLSWSGAQNGTNNAITTYKIYEKVDNGNWAYIASDATSPYTVTAPASNGGKKSYYIVSDGPHGDSPASNTVVMETKVSKPNAPTSVSLSATNNLAPDADVTLSWSGASNATYNNPISGYRIMRSVDGGAYAQIGSDLPSSTSSQVVKTKNGNGTHAFKVIALGTNLDVHSDMSTAVATATTVVSTPAPPSIVEVPGGGGVAPSAVKVLQWSGAAAGTYNNSIRGYQVYRSSDGTNYSAFGSPILTGNTYYSMNVEASSTDGASYYYKVVTLGNTLSINSALSSAYGILSTAKLPSTGTLNKSAVTATGSESVMVTIVPQRSTYTHKVTWYIDGTYTSGEISKSAGETSDTYTIPQSWILATTKTTTSVTAKCKVETFDGATSLGFNEYAFTVNVPTRSTFALSGVPLTANDTAEVLATITSKYSGYKHTVLWSTTGYSQTHNVAAGTPTQAYAIPKAWCNAAPNATSFTVTVKVTTIKATADGDLSLGDETTTFTANVPTDIVPTITSFAATGVNQNWGLYVRTKSSVQWAPVAAGAYSSTIVSYKIENAYLNSGVLNYSTNPNWTSGILNYSGSQVFTLTVTDSRGRTASTTGSITVTNYNPPSIASAMFVRANSGGTIDRNAGTYINLAAAFTYSDIGSNDITAKAYYREVGTTTWLPAGGATVTITGTAPNKLGSVTYGSGSIVISKLYDVKVALTDAYGMVEAVNIVPTVSRVLDFRNTKAAVGGIAAIDYSFQVPVGWKMHVGGNEVLHVGNWEDYAAALEHDHVKADITDFPTSMPASDVSAWAKAESKPSYTWTEIGSKPSTFAPSAHDHVKADITDFPTSMPASDVSAWAKAASKPSYSWSEIDSKPTSMPASDVSAWAKAATKPSYSWSEIDSKPTSMPAISYSDTATNVVTAAQTSASYKGSAGTWASYLIFNHGDGGNYYHQMLRLDFGGGLQSQALSGGVLLGWRTYLDSTNWSSYINTSTFAAASHNHDSSYIQSTSSNQTRIGSLEFAGQDTGGNFYSAPIEIREVNLVAQTQDAPGYAPYLSWHWGNRVQVSMALLANGNLVIRSDGGNGYPLLHSGNYTNYVYPVGAIYMSVVSTSPATIFGGTWAALGGRMLIGVDGTYTAGSTGGSATHTLSVAEMPLHGHSVILRDNGIVGQWGHALDGMNGTEGVMQTGGTGGGGAHNNMPPYLAVYMWKRTA
jgi:hypothetical protein